MSTPTTSRPEHDRFIKYQQSYRDTVPVQPSEGSTPSGKATKTIQSRETKHGEGKMTPEARARAKAQ